MEDIKNKDIINVSNSSTMPTEIKLGPSTSMDLSWLPENERKELLVSHAKGMLDITKKAQELHVDTTILRNVMSELSETTKNVADAGNSVTISHTQTTSVGRTEILMGNTEKAASGKLSKSQTGEMNWTPYYIFAVIAAIILIAAVSRH